MHPASQLSFEETKLRASRSQNDAAGGVDLRMDPKCAHFVTWHRDLSKLMLLKMVKLVSMTTKHSAGKAEDTVIKCCYVTLYAEICTGCNLMTAMEEQDCQIRLELDFFKI